MNINSTMILSSLVFFSLFVCLSLVSSSSSFVSATTFNACGLDNKLEVINYNAPTDPLYFENMHNCDVIIKSSKASLILFRAPSGSNDPISNLSVTIDDFVCANPTDVQECIAFTKPLVNTRNITINNIRQNLDITGKTGILSAVRFYGTVSYVSLEGNINNEKNDNSNAHFLISNMFMSGTVRRTAKLEVHAVHFDATDTVISNASSVIIENVHVSDFNEIVSTGSKVEVAAISFFNEGKMENVPKILFRNIFVYNINLIRSQSNSVNLSAIISDSECFTGLANCTTSNNELKNNINSNYNANNNKNDLFFSSLECGLVVDNLSVHDIREVSSNDDKADVSVSVFKWGTSVNYFQIVFFTNIHLHRIKINHDQPTTTQNLTVSLRGVDFLLPSSLSSSFFGTDLDENAVGNSILKFSNISISDSTTLNRERSSVDIRALSLATSISSSRSATLRYFNDIEISNIVVGGEMYIYDRGGGVNSGKTTTFYGSYVFRINIEGCTNVANDPLLIAEGNADLRTCSFLVENVSVSEITQQELASETDLDAVRVTGVYFDGNVEITAFDLVKFSNVLVENLNSIVAEEVSAIELGSSSSGLVLRGITPPGPAKDLLESKFIIQNVIVRNISLLLLSGSSVDLVQAFGVRFVSDINEIEAEHFLSISITQVLVEDIALYNEKTTGGFSVVAVSTNGKFKAGQQANSKFLVDDIHVQNVTKNLEFRTDANNNNNNPMLLLFKNFKVIGFNHMQGMVQEFQRINISNISVERIDTGNSSSMADFGEIIVSATDLNRETGGEFQYNSFGLYGNFVIENIFIRDIFMHAPENSVITTGVDRRVNALYLRAMFRGYTNFTIQNIGIIGNIHLHLDRVQFAVRVMHILSPTGQGAILAQWMLSSSPFSSFTIRQVCLHPYSSSSSSSSAPASCDHNHYPQLGFPLSQFSSASSPAPELLQSIIAHRENNINPAHDFQTINIKSKDLELYLVRVENGIYHFASTTIENVQAHHIRTEPSELDFTKVTATLIGVTNVFGRSGSQDRTPADQLSRLTIRNLRFFDIDVYEASDKVFLCGFHTLIAGAVDRFNKILVENIIIDQVNLTTVRSGVELRACFFRTDTVTARDIPLVSVSPDSFNSFIQRNSFILNSYVYSQANSNPRIKPQEVMDIVNFDQVSFSRNFIENVSWFAPTSLAEMHLVEFRTVVMNNTDQIYAQIPGFRRSVEFSSFYIKNFLFDGEKIDVRYIFPQMSSDRENIDVFNVSHFYTTSAIITARRGATLAVMHCRNRGIKASTAGALPSGLPRVFTVNNIHSNNLHLTSDDRTTSSDIFREVSLVNGLKISQGFIPITDFDIFDFSNSSIINCSCRQTAAAPRTDRTNYNYANHIAFIYCWFGGNFQGRATTGSELRIVNLHVEDAHLSSPNIQSSRLQAVFFVQRGPATISGNNNLKRVLLENVTLEKCSAVASARRDALNFQGSEVSILSNELPMAGDNSVGSSFEMRNLVITTSHVSSPKNSLLAVMWQIDHSVSQFQNYIFENIQIQNNKLSNSPVDNPTSLVPPADSESHLYAIFTGASTQLQSLASGGTLLFSNISLVGNTVSVTRKAYMLMVRSQNRFQNFHTFIAQLIEFRASRVMTTGFSLIGVIYSSSGIYNDATANLNVETTVSSMFKVDSLLAENNSLEITKSKNDLAPATEYQNSFLLVQLNNVQKIAHILWTNIHVSSLRIKGPENVQDDKVTLSIYLFFIMSGLSSPANDIAVVDSVEYYNNSFVIENISLQNFRFEYFSASLEGFQTIYGVELMGYDGPFCHVSVKNILFKGIYSVSATSIEHPTGSSGAQLHSIINFHYDLKAPSHPTTATLTSASSYSESLPEQEKLEMAFCSLVFSNITLDKFNTSLKVRDSSDRFQMKTIQIGSAIISDYTSITITDITVSSIAIKNLTNTISSSPQQFNVVLFDAGSGIMFDQSYETRNGDFPTVREIDRRLRISNLKIDGLSIAESSGFSVHVSCLSLGKEKNSLIDKAIEDFHSILLSNFSASSVSLVGSKSTASTSTANENNNVFAQDLSCGLALVVLRGRLYRSLTGTTLTNASVIVENFALEKKISVSSLPSSAFVFGFAATKTDQELVDGFNSVIFRNFSTSPLAFLDILSSQRSALFSHLFVRSPVSSSTATASSPSSLSILDFSVSSTTSLVIGSQNDVSRMSVLSLNQSISGFDNVSLRNLHFSPSSVSSVTSGGHNAFTASALEINGLIDIRDSPTSFLKISNVSLCVRTSVLIFGKTTISIDALRIGGWKTADSSSVIIQDISLALSSSLLILGATERKMYSAITITENEGMTSPKTTFSNISVLFVPSSPTIPERISNINFEHSPLDPRTFAITQQIVIKNCTLNVLDSSNSLRKASLLSFASTDARVAGNWSFIGNLVESSSNTTSLISFGKSSSAGDNNQIYDLAAKTSFTFLENDIEKQSPITRKSEILGFVNENDDQPTTPPSSSSSSSPIDFKNTEFHFKCNHWSRSYENDFETIMLDENIVQNARLYHECRSKSISLSLHRNSSTPSTSFGETLSHHRTSLTTSRSVNPTASNSEKSSMTPSNSETYTAPLPPPTLLSDFINAATKTAGVSLSLFAGAHNAINTRKILAISSTADCGKQDADEDEVLEAGPEDNPLSLRIGSGSSKFVSLRGAVVGGFAIILMWAIVMVGFALARQRVDPKQPCSFSRALYKVTMPGTLWVPASSMFPVAVNSCVVIAKRFEGEVIDIVIMIIGFAVAGIATVCVLFWIKRRVDKHEVLLPEGVEEDQIEEYLENIENGGKKKQDEKEKGLLALFKNLADNDDSDKKKTRKCNTTDEEDDSGSKEKDKKKNKKNTSKTKGNNNINYTALLFAKVVTIFDWLTTPKQKYAKTKFSQRFEPLFNWTTVLYFIPLSYISVLVMEIVEANTTLCSKNDRSCCEGGIVTMCVFAGIDLLLIIIMKNPFLVPIDRYLFPVTSLLSFISSILIMTQFYDATSSLSVDGEDMRPENERIDFLDALVLLSQAAFIISMINCCFNGLAEFKNAYSAYTEAKEKKQLKKQRDRQRAANTKKELAEKKKREKLEAAEQEMKVIEKKKKYEEEGLKKGASRRYMALLDDDDDVDFNGEQGMVVDSSAFAGNDHSLLLVSPRSAPSPAFHDVKFKSERNLRSKPRQRNRR